MTTFFERVGGHATFDALVRKFYDGVATDPILRPMYPEDDMEGAIWRLTAFLEQYWGGPGTYSEQRGHPRLRMRHNAFAVTPYARDNWLKHMTVAVDSLGLAPMDREELMDYLDRAAQAMVNSFENESDGRTSLL